MRIAFQDAGQGEPLLAAHCSCASSREWGFLYEALAKDHHILAPDLLGYGKSPAWPPAGGVPTITDVDVLEAMLAQCSEPVHLVGHSYGAVICLELARRDAESNHNRIRSLFLIEPVAFYLLEKSEYQLAWEEIGQLGRHCITAWDRGNAKQAANVFMGYWLGALKWRFAPRRLHAEVIRTIPKVVHEFREMFRYTPDSAHYRQIACPVTLVAGGQSRQPALAVIEVLRQLLPRAQVAAIPRAGHMSPFTHPHDVLALLRAHLVS